MVKTLEEQEAEHNARKAAVAEQYKEQMDRRVSDDEHPRDSTQTVHRVPQPPLKAQKASKAKKAAAKK